MSCDNRCINCSFLEERTEGDSLLDEEEVTRNICLMFDESFLEFEGGAHGQQVKDIVKIDAECGYDGVLVIGNPDMFACAFHQLKEEDSDDKRSTQTP